jgi:glycosyltransferase involved in cell wall biosynthesis
MTRVITVITCTYNPRPDHLARTVAALRAQTHPVADWEYLLVDNNSTDPVSVDLAWHPRARLLSEPKPGKVHALLRSVSEAQGDLLVIVDDDNVLSPDYLETAVNVADTKPFLGVWGGQILPEFEAPPPDWAQPYLNSLTLRRLQREEWSNLHNGPAPAGAGMCLRVCVARRFVENLAAHPERLQLGRTGSSVLTGEDWEMSLAACDLGLGMGHLPQLQLTHLIAARRLEMNYLLHLVETMSFSRQVFVHLRGLHGLLQYPPTRLQRLVRWLNLLRMDPIRRKFLQAEWRALDQANAVISRNNLDHYAVAEALAAEKTGVRVDEKTA